MKKPSKKKTSTLYSVDEVMHNTVTSLIRDFQTNLRDPSFCVKLRESVRSRNIARIRESNPTVDWTDDTYRFKAMYQIQSINKRYRYQTDIYSDDELTKKAIDSFMATQNRLASQNLDNLPANCKVVLDVAAGYISQVLGEYSDEEHRSLCRFGRRASVGIPSAKASLAERWAIPISGSPEQIAWFDSEMSEVECVRNYLHAQLDRDPEGSIYQVTSSLKLTLVPKTFKSLRSIMPNTTIGSYMSYGLGEMIRKRLRKAGYDIKSLQMRHRYLAQQGSVHSQYATADLSSASDSISVALVERLFPTDWLDVLKQSRIGQVTLPDGSVVESKTFCTMGVGYTFPLQTLVFLALLKAIEATLFSSRDRRTISVYGDDLIYSPRMHTEVVYYFEQVGFVINLDKTFHEGNFRESCGGDYYHGVDVRPFQPQNGPASVSKQAYEAVLYKFINGLLMRWSEYEIVGTLNYLVAEIEAITGCCKLVPQNYPDDSGIKCSALGSWEFLQDARVAHPKHVGHGVYRFTYLRLEPKLRKEERHEPYLWDALGDGMVGADYNPALHRLKGPHLLADALMSGLGMEVAVPLLVDKEVYPIETFRSKLTGRRLRRRATFVTVSHSGCYTRQTGFSCFEPVGDAL